MTTGMRLSDTPHWVLPVALCGSLVAVAPLVATAVRSFPFSEGDLSVTVIAEVDRGHERISGLWLDAPENRDLSLDP